MHGLRDIVTGVNVYPIKSAQAATIDNSPPSRLQVGETGFEAYGVRDRDFVVVDADPLETGAHLFVSQRGWDERGRFNRNRDADRLLAAVETDISEAYLTISSLVGTMQLPSSFDESTGMQYDVQIHASVMKAAVDQGDQAAAYFSELLNRSVRLARYNRDYFRPVSEAYRDEMLGGLASSNQIAGADGAPFLLVSEASLAQAHEANGLESGEVPINRYRGNIVIDGRGIGAWGEDYLRVARIGSTTFDVVRACSRCPIPNIDQQTGERSGGGLQVLRGHSGRRPGDEKSQPLFGQNLNHLYGPRTLKPDTIALGDTLHVVAYADRPNFES